MQIFVGDNSEQRQTEAKNKGFRDDVYVKIGTEFFNPKIIDFTRLCQEVRTCFERAAKKITWSEAFGAGS